MSAIASNSVFWYMLLLYRANPYTGEPLEAGDSWFNEVSLFWSILFGGQWGEGGQS